MPDGCFLTPVSGLHYMIHLFDQAEVVLLAAFSGHEARLGHVQEVGRQHGDRLTFLENRHVKLNSRFDLKFAADQEFNDWVSNRADEDWINITGLQRLPGRGREWQSAARKQVTEVIRLVLKANRAHSDFKVLFAVDPLRGRPNTQTVMNVRLNSVESASHIRDLFSGFFRHDRPVQLPQALRGISIRNKVTLQTRIRISILQQFASLYLAANPGSTVRVKGYDSRPLMTIFPAAGSGVSPQPKTYNFIQAVTSFPANFSDEHFARIFGIIGEKHRGELRQFFVVLNDDDHQRCLELARANPRGRSGPRSGPGSSRAGPGVGASSSITTSGVVSGPGDGMDLRTGLMASLKSPPPPPPSDLEVPDKATKRKQAKIVSDDDDNDRRGFKRQRLSSASSSSSERRSRHKTRTHRTRRSSTSSTASASSRDDRKKKSKARKSKSKRSRRDRDRGESESSASSASSSRATKTSKTRK